MISFPILFFFKFTTAFQTGMVFTYPVEQDSCKKCVIENMLLCLLIEAMHDNIYMENAQQGKLKIASLFHSV